MVLLPPLLSSYHHHNRYNPIVVSTTITNTCHKYVIYMFQLPHHSITTNHKSNPREHEKQKIGQQIQPKFFGQKHTLFLVKTRTITHKWNLRNILVTNIGEQNISMIIATTKIISKHKNPDYHFFHFRWTLNISSGNKISLGGYWKSTKVFWSYFLRNLAHPPPIPQVYIHDISHK